ncbi:nucleoside ABC transporter membrane protein [Cryobacterium psychrotolerans]|uniref:Nucleoside ABC transporter membrane protein n=1 Tax=Cryobacterium psychrotolerans TaxID=386301 RepID=A0A1G9CPP6_9MICO|nr:MULTISPECIES: ABC transporter permease [Cryobacterium]TFD47023.1 ABC transporter permease [Cryobacterium sp. TMT1-2-1]TFD84219.1 ABC transporter permease [Cryobacterium psychrotolerans]SDK53693.1 nucleoside ABC transporter membrane protein [Cryobacterium psychrotolerans]
MSTITQTVQPSQGQPALSTVVLRSWKAAIALSIFAVLGLLIFVLLGVDTQGQVSTFRLSQSRDLIQLPDLVLPTFVTAVVSSILLFAMAAWSIWITTHSRKVPLWLVVVFAVVFMIGFLTWAAAGSTIPVPGLFVGTITLSVPLIFGALGGVISERSGVVNVAIEGQLLAGAFSSAVVASITGNPYLGLVAAAIAGVLVSFVLAAFSIKYLVDQVIVGVVLNVLVIGLTSFFFSQLLSPNAAALNTPERFPRINIPLLSEIPILGPALFRQTFIVYFMYVAVAVIYFGLFHTKWGLRLRSVGEHPKAADTVGINVNGTRFWNVSLAGAIVGFGGAYFTLGSVGAFNKEMTAGLGFIALAAVIFGRWDPLKATLAALLFGFASNLQNVLSIIGSPVPSEFMLMLPYVVTIFAVAGLVGRSRPPAADGKPYIK